MMEDQFHELTIEAILEDELYTNPPLMPVVVATLTGTKQDIPRAFRLTKDIASTASLKHLRRIRDTEKGLIECIICSLKDRSNSEEAYLHSLETRFEPDNIFKDFRIALVPSQSPRTSHQLKACQDLWPCKFAKSDYLIKCIEGTVFEPAERIVIKLITKRLLEEINNPGSQHASGAVIFRYNRIYGVGLSSREAVESHPIKHSSMLAIDSVAHNIGSGHWTHPPNRETELQAIIQQDLDSRAELNDHKSDAGFLPYLCTNYDVLLTEQPCMMCAMALVQSRIRRLFYLERTNIAEATCYPDGAIDKFMVHRDKSLNHRFEAWRIVSIKS